METYNENIEELTPEQIAERLFTQEPKNKVSYMPYMTDEESDPLEYIFEILITICLEGLEIRNGGNLSQVNLDLVSAQVIESLNPWFRSMKIKIKCDEFEYNEENKSKYGNNYCNIYIRDRLYEEWFKIRKINGNYRFTLNGNYLPQDNLRDIYAKYIYKNKIFIISFDIDQNASFP